MCFRKEPLFLQEETQRGKERLFCCSLGTASQEKKVRSKQEEEDNGSFQEDHVVSLFSSFKKWFNPTKKDARRMVFFLRAAALLFAEEPLCYSSCSETHRLLSLEESQEKKEQEPLFLPQEKPLFFVVSRGFFSWDSSNKQANQKTKNRFVVNRFVVKCVSN